MSPQTLTEHSTFATDLADFLHALQGIDPTCGPGPGTHNWFRGGPLSTYNDLVAGALPSLSAHEAARLEQIWRSAVQVPWDQQPVWFHGDIAPGNLLMHQGRLSAVIDFGTCGVGDPACDLAIAWTMLSGRSRQTFRTALAVDPATWARARGWALWKTLVAHAGTEQGSPERLRAAQALKHLNADTQSD